MNCTTPPDQYALTLTPGGRLEQLRHLGYITIATAITQPFEYRDPATSSLTGFDVDLMTRIVEPLDVKIHWREMVFADLLSELEAGNVDIVIAAMYITPERASRVDFSQTYLETGLVLVTRRDNMSIHSLNDLTGHLVGVKEGSTGEKKMDQMRQGENITIQIHRYSDTLDSLDDLNNGLVDAVLNDRLNTLQYIQTHPEIEIRGDILEPAGLGIATHKNDGELLDFIDSRLATFKTDQTITTLFNQWINPDTAHVVP
jgi:ABC-type amino acid transport substrate-binding protein